LCDNRCGSARRRSREAGSAMRQALLLIPLSILAFLAVYSGDACGSGFREGGFPGCVREIGREFGGLRESATSESSSPSFGDTGRAITARPTAGAPVTGGTASGPTESWRQVTFWSGRASKDTEPFLVARPAWRITWSAKGGPSSAAVSL